MVFCTHQQSCVSTAWCTVRKQSFSSNYILHVSRSVQSWDDVVRSTQLNALPGRKSWLVLVTETQSRHANSWCNGGHRLLRVCVHWYTINTTNTDYVVSLPVTRFALQRHSYSTRKSHVTIANCSTCPVNVLHKYFSELTFFSRPTVNNRRAILPENKWKVQCPANPCVMYWVRS